MKMTGIAGPRRGQLVPQHDARRAGKVDIGDQTIRPTLGLSFEERFRRGVALSREALVFGRLLRTAPMESEEPARDDYWVAKTPATNGPLPKCCARQRAARLTSACWR
jgi:hypothetical protein